MITFAQGTWLLMEKAQHQQSQQEIGHGPSADSLLLQLLRSLLHFEFSSLSLGVVKIQKQLRSQDRKKTPIINLLHIGPAFYLMNVSHQVLRISNSSTRASITKLLLVGSTPSRYYSMIVPSLQQPLMLISQQSHQDHKNSNHNNLPGCTSIVSIILVMRASSRYNSTEHSKNNTILRFKVEYSRRRG